MRERAGEETAKDGGGAVDGGRPFGTDRDRLDALASFLLYPEQPLGPDAQGLREELETSCPEAASHLACFLGGVCRLAPEEQEELYTRTFDMNPAATLEAGWHLYGESYSRGAFLVEIREALKLHGVEESRELPDHLSHLLRLLARLPQERAGQLSGERVMPALARTLEGVGEENPYRRLLLSIHSYLASLWGPGAPPPAPMQSPGSAVSFEESSP